MAEQRASQPIQVYLDELLKREGPDEPTIQSNRLFCTERIHASLEKIEGVLTTSYPQKKGDIAKRLSDAQTSFVSIAPSYLHHEGDQFYAQAPNQQRVPVASPFTRALMEVNPQLGPMEYTHPMLAPRNLRGGRSYIHYTNRFKMMAETAHLQPSHPLLQLIAVSYVTQIAKDLAVGETNALTRTARNLTDHTDQNVLDTFLDSITGRVQTIRRHELFVQLGMRAFEETLQKNNITPEQARIVTDIAYASSQGVDGQTGEFRSLLEPIIRAMASGDWEKATTYHQFVTHYVAGILVPWRQKELQDTTESLPYTSIKDLTTALRKGTLSLTQDDIPEEYRKFFDGLIARRVVAETKKDQASILRASTGLSTAIAKQIYSKENSVEFRSNHQELAIYWNGEDWKYEDFGEYITRHMQYLYRDEDNLFSNAKQEIINLQKAIIALYKQEQQKPLNKPTYSLSEYLRALLLPERRQDMLTQHATMLERFVGEIETRFAEEA